MRPRRPAPLYGEPESCQYDALAVNARQQLIKAFGAAADLVVALDASAPAASEPLAERRSAGQSSERGRERVRVSGGNQQSRLAVADGAADGADSAGDDGARARHRFAHDVG